jgi:hypothetical protein
VQPDVIYHCLLSWQKPLRSAGWLLFLVFAGMGVLATPIDWIQQFLGRPKTVITKSEYIRRARLVAQRAKQLVVRFEE